MFLRGILKYWRLWLFQYCLGPVSVRARRRRMTQFVELIGLRRHDRVLDLGGHPDVWEYVDIPLRITILNLKGALETRSINRHRLSYVEGDACNVQMFSEGDFDVVYSNSVVEHVGPKKAQKAFAEQVRKFKTKYWIQTPAKWFPVEAHCGMPFWWFYPQSWRNWLLQRWRSKLPAWTNMVEGTRFLEKRHFCGMFSDSRLRTERVFGIPKSYVVWSVPPNGAECLRHRHR